MSFLHRILPAPQPRIEDALAALAAQNRIEQITFADRFAAVCDAIDGAPEAEAAAMIRPILALITDRTLRLAVLRAVQEDTWRDVA